METEHLHIATDTPPTRASQGHEDLQGRLGQRVLLDILEKEVNRDKVDPVVNREALDLLDHLERRENMEMRDDLVKPVPKAHPGRGDTGECQACQGCQVTKDIGDCPELRGQEEIPDRRDHGDLMVSLVCLDFQDLWVQMVCLVNVA